MTTLKLIFLILVLIVAYSYVGYGALLFTIVKLKRLLSRKSTKAVNSILPEVTLLIAAYNEEDFIENKINNSLKLNYPQQKLKIIVVADGSTDRTPQLVRQYANVRLLFHPIRKGKTHAINRAMNEIDTPITIFTDANTALNSEAIMQLVKHFNDPTVGCVAGEKRIMMQDSDKATTAGEGIYWKYESKLKQWDYELYSTAGAAGELFAIRTDLYKQTEEDTILDDFIISLRIVESGYKIAYEPNAYAMEGSSANTREELKRKTRICAGGFQAIIRLMSLLNVAKHPIFSFQYFSHRVLRWTLAPMALLLLIPVHFWLVRAHDPLLNTLFALHLLFYLFAFIGWLLEEKNTRLKIFFIPYYFILMNYSVFIGFYRFINQKQDHIWQRAQRASI